MNKIKFYVCPQCGNLMTATGNATISCCGKTLEPLVAKKAEEARIACIKIDENAKKKLAELKKMEEKQGE